MKSVRIVLSLVVVCSFLTWNCKPDPPEQPSGPSISSISPTSGPVGSTVTITGTNFSATPAQNTVKFNGTSASILSASTTQLVVTVPTGASTGAVTVIVHEKTSNEITFNVLDITVTRFAGGDAGYKNGSALEAQFFYPKSITTDLDGNLYVADNVNYCIRKINSITGVVSLFGGTPTVFGYADGPVMDAHFLYPRGIATGKTGNIYIVDNGNHCIRKISGGLVTTIAGNPQRMGWQDGPGVTAAKFSGPVGIVADQSENLYIADADNNRIRKIDADGIVSTIAGTGEAGYTDGPGKTASKFFSPEGIAIGPNGIIYVADRKNNRIRKIGTDGIVSTIAGTGEAGYADGLAAMAKFNAPTGLAIDPSGNIYVADKNNQRIRRITSDGVVQTIAGTGSIGSENGTGTVAQFKYPTDIIIDRSGNLFVTDGDNHQVRKIIIR